ncbi:MAG: GTPase ObgE [Chloroflexi bacterium]|nr:MAG: GTPase ObgE [Chloroflexota bacterium]
MFFDKARIHVSAGNGGNGIVAFRREKFMPLGGPAGGNGGRGGHVYLVVDTSLNTLHSFHRQIHYKAERGGHGGGADKTGAFGADLYIPVPLGTLVRNHETGEILADMVRPDQQTLLVRGGRGGRGNAAFKSSRNNAPQVAENGEMGDAAWVDLEMKIVADVGIVGVPNAGKSTLLSVISAARPKIADYPFTTVEPSLGVAEVNHRQIVVTDIPGLLEGAHEGFGLGLDFLRHVERSRILIHLLNGASPDPLGDYAAINLEMELFNPRLVNKPQLVVLNKMDLPEAQAAWPQIEQTIVALGKPVMAISAVTRANVNMLLYRLQEMLDALPVEDVVAADELVEISPTADESAFAISQLEPDLWEVQGIAIERAAQMTNWDYYEAAMRFQRILKAMGVTEALTTAGVVEGDRVQIAGVELIWGYDNAFGE